MSARTLGNVGLSAFWALCENAWKDLMDANLVRLSNLVQGHAKSLVTSLPGSPVNGDVYILTDAAGSHPTEIAIRDNGAWVYTVPLEGWIMWIDDVDTFYVFTGTVWTSLASVFGKQGTDIASAATITPSDGNYFKVTGTTGITDIDFSPDKNGRMVFLEFAGALTLTHSSTLILPGAANIATAAGDVACFVSEGSDVARCLFYTKASGGSSVRRQAVTSAATVTPTFSNDIVDITALAAACELMNWTGTAEDGYGLVVRIKDDGTARALTYDTKYRGLGAALPSTTIVSKYMILVFLYNATDDKFDLVNVINQV